MDHPMGPPGPMPVRARTSHDPGERGRHPKGGPDTRGQDRVIPPVVERLLLERRLAAALRAAEGLVPFSPAWDAAMANVEELQRELWNRQAEDAEAAVGTLPAPSHAQP